MKFKKIIMLMLFLIVSTSTLFSNEKRDQIINQKIEMKVKKKKRVQQSLSLLQEYLPEFYDIIEEENTSYSQQYLNVANHSIIYTGNSVFDLITNRVKLLQNIKDWLGTPYHYGGHSKKGVDCSGFTSSIVNESLETPILKGTAQTQSKMFKSIKSIDSLKFGDIIFFSKTKLAKRINHVAVYLGNNIFVHSSSKSGVIISILDDYYAGRYKFGGRIQQINYAFKIGEYYGRCRQENAYVSCKTRWCCTVSYWFGLPFYVLK